MARNRLAEFAIERGRIETYLCWRHRHDHGEFRCAPRVMSDYNLIYLIRGRAAWRIEGQEFPLHAGRLLIVPPGRRHEAYPKTRRVHMLSLHLNATLPGGRDVFGLLGVPVTLDPPADSRLVGYLEAAASEFDRAQPGDAQQTMQGWNRLIVSELIRVADAAGRLAPKATDPLVSELLEELHRRIDEPTTLDDLAAWSGYSAQHLNRRFRDTLGVTPLKYLTSLRIDRARTLLLEPGLTLAAVTRRVGFDDPYYFSRLFKRHVGLSPSGYRAQAGSENPS